MHTEINPLKGIILSLICYFFISLMGIAQKCISSDVTLPTILFFQNAVCLFLVMFSLVRSKEPIFVFNHPWTYFIRISSGLACYAALFYLIRYIPVSEALLYQYSASLWIPFIMMYWLKVRMPRRLWSGILVGFVGMILILKPKDTSLDFIAAVGLLCGFLQGISVVAIRKLYDEPIARMLFYYFLAGVIASGALAIPQWPTLGRLDLILLLSLGVMTYLGQQFFAHASLYAHPSTLAPICYTSIVYSGILGWLFWNEVPDTGTLMGMMLVIGGCSMTILMHRKPKKPAVLASEMAS